MVVGRRSTPRVPLWSDAVGPGPTGAGGLECMTRKGSASCHWRARPTGTSRALAVTHVTRAPRRPDGDRRSAPNRCRDPTYKAGQSWVRDPPRPPDDLRFSAARHAGPANAKPTDPSGSEPDRGPPHAEFAGDVVYRPIGAQDHLSHSWRDSSGYANGLLTRTPSCES